MDDNYQEPLPWETGEEEERPVEQVKEEPESKLDVKLEEPKHSEAPASVTVKVKSPAGFVYMWTMRDDHSATLFFKINAMERKWGIKGFTPVEERSGGFPKKAETPKNFVPGRVCPKDGGQLYDWTSKNGARALKCENGRYNYATKMTEGCDFIEWKS